MTLRGKHNLIYKFRTWRNEDRDNIVRLQFWHVLALTERHRFVSLHVSHQPVEYLNIAVYRDVNLLGVSLTLSTLKVSLNNLATVNASCTIKVSHYCAGIVSWWVLTQRLWEFELGDWMSTQNRSEVSIWRDIARYGHDLKPFSKGRCSTLESQINACTLQTSCPTSWNSPTQKLSPRIVTSAHSFTTI